MSSTFSPTQEDVRQYTRLRAAAVNLNLGIIKTIPEQAYQDVGRAIGILHRDTLVFESEDMTSVLMDCCLYDWLENGKNLIERYAEAHPSPPGTDERYLLDAYLQAHYRIILPKSSVRDAGLYCRDVLTPEEFFLMDVGLSRTFHGEGAVLASRTIPMGRYWMTGGAGLPMTRRAMDVFLPRAEKERFLPGDRSADLHKMALEIVRACLATGVADHVSYQHLGAHQPHVGRSPGRNKPCQCGSGKKHKVCCGRA